MAEVDFKQHAKNQKIYLENIYPDPRREFIETYGSDHSLAKRLLSPELHANTVKDILNEKVDEPEQRNASTMQAVIDLMAPYHSPRLYHRFGRAIGQEPSDVNEMSKKKLFTVMRYYRFIKSGTAKFTKISGLIRVHNFNGLALFEHWPDYTKSRAQKLIEGLSSTEDIADLDHTNRGFVYLRKNRLTMQGWRTDTFRQVIATVPNTEEWDAKTVLLQGGVLSITISDARVFMSRFVIAGHGHKYFFKEMPDQELKDEIEGKTSAEHGFIDCQ